MAYNLPVSTFGVQPFGNSTSNNALQLILQLVGQASAGREEARQANESRYNDILSLFGLNRKRALDALDNLSNQQVADANQSYDELRHNLITDLADRGLSGSTKRIAVESMTKRERDAAVNRIKDAMTLNRNATDLGFTDRATGVMERRSDPYPDTSNVGALVAQLAPLLARNANNNMGGNANLPARQPAYAPTAPLSGPDMRAKTASAVAQVNALRAQDGAAQAEANRRGGMIALKRAIETGGLEGEDRTRAALDYLVQNGWAAQNPNTVSTAPFAQPQPSYYPNYVPETAGVYQQPSTGYMRTPLWQRDPVFASILQKRRQRLGQSPTAPAYGQTMASTYGDYPVV